MILSKHILTVLILVVSMAVVAHAQPSVTGGGSSSSGGGSTTLPAPDSSLQVLQSDGLTAIGTAGAVKGSSFQVRATAPTWTGDLQLEVEMRTVGAAWTGVPTQTSPPVPSGTATVVFSGTADGIYELRARWAETAAGGVTSEYTEVPDTPDVLVTTGGYASGFETAEETTGWFVAAGQFGAVWAFDADPWAPFAGTASLNFNDGTDFEFIGQTAFGSVTSPQVWLGQIASAQLRFRCNYETETTGTDKDRRIVRVLDDAGGLVIEQTLETIAGVCDAMGTWHEHRIDLPGLDAARCYRVEFDFNSVDGLLNAFAGWFIDELILGEALPPSTGGGGDEPGVVIHDSEGTEGGILCSAAPTAIPSAGWMLLLILLLLVRRNR